MIALKNRIKNYILVPAKNGVVATYKAIVKAAVAAKDAIVN